MQLLVAPCGENSVFTGVAHRVESEHIKLMFIDEEVRKKTLNNLLEHDRALNSSEVVGPLCIFRRRFFCVQWPYLSFLSFSIKIQICLQFMQS